MCHAAAVDITQSYLAHHEVGSVPKHIMRVDKVIGSLHTYVVGTYIVKGGM